MPFLPRPVLLPAVVTAAALALWPALLPGDAMASGRRGTPASPSVRVDGNRLVDGSGRPVRLLGVNKAGSEYACAQGWGIFDGPVDDAAVAAIASWKVTAVRVPLNEDCWLGVNGVATAYSGETYRSAVQDFVGRLRAAGLFAVLDLHWSAPGTRLALAQQVMADADHSVDFWRSVASRFRQDPGVVFDLFNEPHDIGWDCWRSGCVTSEGWQAAGMQQLLDAVRGAGAKQPVIVSGLNWGGDLSQWRAYAPTDPAHQLVAGVHVYSFSLCHDSACWDATIAPVAAAVPVVTTELGEDQCTGDFTRTYLQWADAAGVDYLGWTWNVWDCGSGPALITSPDGSPTAFGAALHDHLRGLASATASSATALSSWPSRRSRSCRRPAARPARAAGRAARGTRCRLARWRGSRRTSGG